MTTDKRDTFEEQAEHIIQVAWSINGTSELGDETEIQLRILNGLLAMAIAEVLAPPTTPSAFGADLVRLGRDVLKGDDE